MAATETGFRKGLEFPKGGGDDGAEVVIEHIVPLEAEVAMLVELLADVEAAVEGLVVVTDYTVGKFVGIPDELGTALPLLGEKVFRYEADGMPGGANTFACSRLFEGVKVVACRKREASYLVIDRGIGLEVFFVIAGGVVAAVGFGGEVGLGVAVSHLELIDARLFEICFAANEGACCVGPQFDEHVEGTGVGELAVVGKLELMAWMWSDYGAGLKHIARGALRPTT